MDASRSPRAPLAHVLTAFGLGFWWTYLVTTVRATPMLWYFPLERRFAWGLRPTALAADFYGRMLWGCAVGLGLAALCWPLRRWLSERPLWLTRMLVWGASSMLFTLGLYLYLLTGRISPPAALPQGYVPR